MTDIHKTNNYDDLKHVSGNSGNPNPQRVKDLTDAIKGSKGGNKNKRHTRLPASKATKEIQDTRNDFLRKDVAAITNAFKNIPQPEMRELNEEEKNLNMHYVFFSPTTYVSNAFDHQTDHDIDIYNVDNKIVASTFAINGSLTSAKEFKERSSDNIYLGIGQKLNIGKLGYVHKLRSDEGLKIVGEMIGKSGNDMSKWLQDNEQLEHIDAYNEE